MKKALLYIILFIFSFSAFGQLNTDSLIQVLPEISELARIDMLNTLSYAFSESDSAKSLQYANQAIVLAEKYDDLHANAIGHFNIGECYYYNDVYDRASKNYDQALDLFIQLNDSLNIGETLNSIGLVFYFTSDYNSAAKKFYRALDYFKRDEFKGNAAHVYSNIGMLDTRINENLKAVKNYLFAAKLNKEINETASIAVNYNGVGVSYYNLAEYDSSKVYYNKALGLFRKLKSKKREAIALNNLANIYVNTGDSLNQALAYYLQAIQVFDELNDVRSKAFVLEGLGSVYRELGRFQDAISTFKESLELIRKNHFGFYLQQLNYHDLSLTYERMGRTTDALDAFKLYSEYKDSLLREERLNQVAELEKKYQTKQKEAEIERLNVSREIDQLQIKRDEELRTFGIIAILLLVAVIFIVSLAYLNKKRTNDLLNRKNLKIEEQRKELEKLNASKNKFFSIIAHDLKNPFHTVMGYSYLLDKEFDHFSDVEKRKYASDIYKSSNSIFRLLQNLLDWSRSQTGRLKYSPQELDFGDIYENIQNLLKPMADKKNIGLHIEMDGESNVFADPMMLEAVLRNLLNNAIKFTHEKGVVKTTVKDEGTKVQVCVQDNGVGIHTDELENLFQIDSKHKRKGTNHEDGSGLGLIICEEFVKKNGGVIWADSKPGEGSRFYFTIPKS